MKKDIINNRKSYKHILKKEGYEGESIENKVSRIVENNEPISDGAPLVYTERSKGVLPEYNIRTDKWDLALEKMEVVNEAKRNKIKESMKNKDVPKKEEEPKQEEKN